MLKIILPTILFLHGIIHIVGFVKSVRPNAVKVLKEPISAMQGFFWLLAGILFLSGAVFLYLDINLNWAFLLPAIILSQVLLILNWKEAKYGTVVNLIVVFIVIVSFSTWQFRKTYEDEVKENLSQASYYGSEMLSMDDVRELPEPVIRYLEYTHSIGKPKVNHFEVSFTGRIRAKKSNEWMPFKSEQNNFMHDPTRLFFMDAVMKHLPVAGYHHYLKGVAAMDIRLLSLFTVQYFDGEEMNVAETVTFFNDMCIMAPATLIDKRISWEQLSDDSVKAKFSYKDITISAILVFNNEGALINFISDDRFNFEEKRRMRWSTPITEYREINGYRLGAFAKTVYKYDDDEFAYGEFELKSIKLN